MNAMDEVSGEQAGRQEIVTANLKKVFDPFFTTKPHGMGMGLVIVRTIIVAHQAQISVENQISGGALFTIRLRLRAGVNERPRLRPMLAAVKPKGGV